MQISKHFGLSEATTEWVPRHDSTVSRGESIEPGYVRFGVVLEVLLKVGDNALEDSIIIVVKSQSDYRNN